MKALSEWDKAQRVSATADEVVLGYAKDRSDYILRAVAVGRGIEITRGSNYHGWVGAKAARKWAREVQWLAERIGKRYEEGPR